MTTALAIQTEDDWIAEGDFSVENHGTIYLMRPNNDEAADWLEEESQAAWMAGEDWQFMGRALVVEPRYLSNIVYLIEDYGWRLV